MTDISLLLTSCLLSLMFHQIMTSLASHLPILNNNIMLCCPHPISLCKWPPTGHSNLAPHYSNSIYLAVGNYMLLLCFCYSYNPIIFTDSIVQITVSAWNDPFWVPTLFFPQTHFKYLILLGPHYPLLCHKAFSDSSPKLSHSYDFLIFSLY